MTSGDLAVPSTITPLIAVQLVGDVMLRGTNDGSDTGLFEVSFSFDNINFIVHQPSSVDLNGGDGAGCPAAQAFHTWLPKVRPPYLRVRGKAGSTSTVLKLDAYQMATVREQARGGQL